ncbi:MAG: WbuC family cupin fold metalloprotein [Bacteroidales bacterium]|nr:WbuC family cupin fold metalloprotein [Bacteroidales bacterium]
MIKINEEFISVTSEKAKNSPRRRMNFNFHKEDAATLQRMLNAMEPDTYIQPHKHENPDKTEAFFVLRGKLLVVEFDNTGQIAAHMILDAEKGNFGAEIAPRTWHTVISLEPGSVAYEVKDGPYDVTLDKFFAPWAPIEGKDDESRKLGIAFNAKILKALELD